MSRNVKWTKNIQKAEEKKSHMKSGFLIIEPRLGMVAAFWLAGFYCLLLDPGKTIINLIKKMLLLFWYHKRIKTVPLGCTVLL